MSLALKELGLTNRPTGPNGGDVGNSAYYPEARDSHLKAETDEATGLPKLHRFREDREVTPVAIAGRQNEKPWHRMAAFMLLNGAPNTEIAAAAGVTVQTITGLKAQRWFQELLAKLANAQGQDITALFHSEAAASVAKLVALRDSAESERVQFAAALALVEHAHGKPTQHIKSEVVTRKMSATEELAQIDEELRSLRESNSRIVPSTTTPIETTDLCPSQPQNSQEGTSSETPTQPSLGASTPAE